MIIHDSDLNDHDAVVLDKPHLIRADQIHSSQSSDDEDVTRESGDGKVVIVVFYFFILIFLFNFINRLKFHLWCIESLQSLNMIFLCSPTMIKNSNLTIRC